MLARIFIQNFALIETLEINFQNGLQVITGETGAGKSIILGALRLILGERADQKSIANPDQKSVVEAEFTISDALKPFFEEQDLDFETHSIIRREILPNGKSRAFINDVPVTLDVLKELSEHLIDIHSQFENANLFNEAYQFNIVDGLSDNKNIIILYQTHFAEVKLLKKQLDKLLLQLSEGNKEKDYKDFLLTELLEANLDQLDYPNLQNQLTTQEHAEQISSQLSEVLGRVLQEELGILDALQDIKNKLSKTVNLAPNLSLLSQRLDGLFLEFKDLSAELQNEAEKIEINPKLLEELSLAQNKINHLFLKHNVNSIAELVDIRNAISTEQSGFADLENQIAKTKQTLLEQEQKLENLAQKLSENRKKSAPILINKMETLLQNLGLENAKIEVQLTEQAQFNAYGKEHIELLFQANAGFSLKPIKTAISGGERSRVMLVIKKIMAENAALPSLILDEIDTGVSGKIADEMGKMMQQMAQNMQLIVITHLAQIAAKGDHNFKVTKEEISGKTQTNIVVLNPREKLQEIAQLLSGSTVTEAALKQAEELMK